jgi:hypothetical protein
VFEDDPQGTAESVAATAMAYGSEAWGRILGGCDRVVVARLLGLMMTVVLEWVRDGAMAGFIGCWDDCYLTRS